MLVRINRDWEDLEEESQISLRDEIVRFLAQPTLNTSTRSKLEEALVKVMERAGSWWKDPIGELLTNLAQENLRLLSLIAGLATSTSGDSSAYRWHHQLKESSTRLLIYLQSYSEINSLLLDCLRNWITFGAFNFTALMHLLPTIFAVSSAVDVVDLLVEVCELPNRDESEESKKLDCFLPFLQQEFEDEEQAARIASALTESTSSVLVSRCAEPSIQNFFRLLLRLSSVEGVAGVEEDCSASLLTTWYLICEVAGEVDVPAQQQILLSILSALATILLKKAKIPEANVWSSLPRDQQQQFLQLRREFLDTFLYLQRVFQSFGSSQLLEFFFEGLKAASSTSELEVQLRALIVVAEEADEWTPQWSSILSLLFSSPPSGLVNAKLTISLVGTLLPCMSAIDAEQAVQMLLSQLDSPEITDECLTALQRAADCEISCLQQPETIAKLAQRVNQSSSEAFIRFLTRLLSDLREEERFSAFFQFLHTVSLTSTQLTYAFTAFKMPKQDFLNLDSLTRLNQLLLANDVDCLIAALEAFSQSGPVAFECVVAAGKGRVEAQRTLLSWISTLNPVSAAFRILNAACVAWGVEATELVSLATQSFLAHQFVDLNEQDEAGELLMESWIRMVGLSDCQLLLNLLRNYALNRLVSGAVSVPTTRIITKFICFAIEHDYAVNEYELLCSSILSAGMSGKLGRPGMEIAARILFEISGKNPTQFSRLLAQQVGPEERNFLRSIGAAHTLKKFKAALVDFCVAFRIGE